MLPPGTYASATVTVDSRGRILALTGDLIATGVPTGHRSLAPGTYTNATITIDQSGRLVSIANGATATDQVPQRQRTLTRGTYTIPTITIDRYGRVVSIASGEEATDSIDLDAITVSDNVACIAIDGDIAYLGGYFTSVTDASGTYTRNGGAALDLTTGLFTAWDPDVSGGSPAAYISAIKIIGSNAYIGGSFLTVGGTSRRKAAKVDKTSGALVSAFDTDPLSTYGPSDYVSAFESDGSYLYIGGSFTNVQPPTFTPIVHLARVDLTTGVRDSWNPDPNDAVEHLYLDGTTLYGSGNFTTAGSARNRFAAWNTGTGALDATFDTDYAGGQISDFAPYSGTLVFAGGNAGLLSVGSVDDATGALTAWDGAAENNSDSKAIVVDGADVYVGGNFTTIGGQSRNRAARLDTVTALADSWNPDANDTVLAMAITNDYVLLGGEFTTINGTAKTYFAIVDKVTGLLAT